MKALPVCLLLVAPLAANEESYASDEQGYREIARPFFEQHCIDCHGNKKSKGDLNLESGLRPDFLDLAAAAQWGEILNAVNGHEMPPEEEPQPEPESASRLAEWIQGELARAERSKKSSRIVLRRLNRAEYANTIRDLLGVTFDPADFPEDPPAGGFDNIGAALTLSPLHLELYYKTTRELVDKAIVTGEKPPVIKWRFEPDESTSGPDRDRVKRGRNNIILNGGARNKVVDGFVVSRSTGWDRIVGLRDFVLDHPGEYLIRIRAASRTPKRDEVLGMIEPLLIERAEKEAKKRGREVNRKYLQREIDHFRADPMYDYGPARLRIEGKLGGQPAFSHEFDLDAPWPEAREFEHRAFLTTENAGLRFRPAYEIPKVLENHWVQNREEFPRPEAMIDWIELEGPIHEKWPPNSHTRLLEGLPEDLSKAGKAEARKVLQRFMTRAWRRPVNNDEVDRKLLLFEAARGERTFLEALKPALVSTLTSPHFLYLAEPALAGRPLTQHELASRLSYFLWSSLPDARLRDLADRGLLSKPDVLKAEADRLLASEKSTAFVRNFAGQWLELRKIGANPPASDLFPRYDRHLETSIEQESLAFFKEILKNDLSLMNFIKSDFVTINERLARFYGIPGVRGDHFRRIRVPNGLNRGGIVTQASVLSITSNGTRTSPVVRGTWILRNLLGTDPGLPVENVGEIAPKVPGIDKATVRQRLAIHRELPQCARCHNKIDPLGLSLENFNAAGEWRLQEGFGYKGRINDDDPDIDASAIMPDGTAFTGVAGLQEQLLRKNELFLRCLAGKLTTYALGRELGYADEAYLDDAVAHLQGTKNTLRSLIHFIVTSELFTTR